MRFTFKTTFIALALCGSASLWAAPPMADPTVEELVRALGTSAVSKAFNGGFRRTAAPDRNHFCPEVSSSMGNSYGATGRKNLEVVPYDGGHAVSADLALHFALGSDKLDASDRNILDTLVLALRDPRLANGRFAIAGHTDASGSAQTNLQLSCARAISARAYLIQNGISGERLSAYGFGSDRLLDAANPWSAVNRRVEIRRDLDTNGR